MARFMLQHRHAPDECGVVFASFKAFPTPLHRRMTSGSCDYGTHHIWWEVEARSEDDALALLPHYVAARTTALRVRDLETP